MRPKEAVSAASYNPVTTQFIFFFERNRGGAKGLRGRLTVAPRVVKGRCQATGKPQKQAVESGSGRGRLGNANHRGEKAREKENVKGERSRGEKETMSVRTSWSSGMFVGFDQAKENRASGIVFRKPQNRRGNQKTMDRKRRKRRRRRRKKERER